VGGEDVVDVSKMADLNGVDLTETSACIICPIPIFFIVGFVWGKGIGWGGGALDLSK
jgi:hypothetical protein